MTLNQRANRVCDLRFQRDTESDGGFQHSLQFPSLVDKNKHKRLERRSALVLGVSVTRDAYSTQLHAEGEVAENLKHFDLVGEVLEEQEVLQLEEERLQLVVVDARRVQRREHATPLNHSLQQGKQSEEAVVWSGWDSADSRMKREGESHKGTT